VDVIDFALLEVRSTAHWIWQIHENQAYLGRLVFRLKRQLFASLAQCTKQEWGALRNQLIEYERVARELFQPDRFNYGQLGNVYPQLHVHAIPRYETPRQWGEMRFLDQRWGENWSPSPPSPMSMEETYEFARWMKRRLREV
jgi:diadenosine tetraphosphate (Ap4A) HIT family hydrolase